MAKPIQLTWKDEETVKKERCLLIEEDDPLFLTDGTPINREGSELFTSNRVVFEDDEGIFGLTPDQIVSIKVLSR